MRMILASRELVALPGGESLAVHCTSGTLWVTQYGDPKDVVLEAGQWTALDRPGVALVQALAAAGFECRPLPQGARSWRVVPRLRFA